MEDQILFHCICCSQCLCAADITVITWPVYTSLIYSMKTENHTRAHDLKTPESSHRTRGKSECDASVNLLCLD